MDKDSNAINWFEIPTVDILRAKKFYETIFGIEMMDMGEMMGMKMIGFPSEPMNGKASGCIINSPQHKPSMDGVVIYLNANPSINDVANRVVAAGGKMLMPVTQISPEIGHMAMFIDTEGNKMAIHSSN